MKMSRGTDLKYYYRHSLEQVKDSTCKDLFISLMNELDAMMDRIVELEAKD